ncbi:MAG TPA: GAF domain-containing SpoIIE family protein phosphatase [Thermoleophilaceae bacterium]|nr:GAF domain-containing SpoIIE family protein phosphatase [Thermoleophilaceae bacterium]
MSDDVPVIDFDAPPPPRRAARFNALESRLLSLVIRRDDAGRVVSPGLLQRVLALLYLSGATIGVVSMAFPQPPGTSVAGLFAVYGVAYAVGVLLFLTLDRASAWVPELGLAFGTLLITLAIHFTEARTGVYAMFYVWVSISAFYFLSWERGFLQIALIAGFFAAVLLMERPAAGAEEWIITLGTVSVAGLFVGALRRGVERLIANLEESARTDHARLYAAERAARLEADRASESLRRLQQVTDVALSHLDLEELLEELLGRVRQVLGVDTAAVMLLEDGALAIRAALGIDESAWRGLSIPVGEGFGGRVAERRRLLVVRGEDETRRVSPQLSDLGLCAMMGAPLLVEGDVIGVIHVGSYTDREFDEEEKRLLSLVADRAALAITHARLYEREHGIAETLQRSLLPRSLPRVPGAVVAARYLPARAEAQVGGDWYDVVPLTGGGLALTIGDVSGHGVEAASLMGSLRDGLRAAALEGESVARATERVDRLLQSQRGGGDDAIATALFGVLGADGAHLDFTSAGHPPPLVIRPDGSAEFVLGGLSTPLGVLANGSRPTARIDLEPGSLLLLYTDGLVERRDASIEVGMRRLAEAAREADRDPELFCEAVVHAMLGSEGPADDVALLAVATGS